MSRTQRRVEAKLSRRLLKFSQKYQSNLFKTMTYKVDVSDKAEIFAAIDAWLEKNCVGVRIANKRIVNRARIVEIGFADVVDYTAFKKFMGMPV